MLLRQFRFGKNLLTHVRENAAFLRQKPWKLLSAEANFEGCIKRKRQKSKELSMDL